ncbi:MAG: response regulator [Anaerolineae bacterium]|nr:response regulator [Anaerolineae bacterium]
MKLRIPVFAKIIAPLVVIIALSVGISGYQVYLGSTQRWQSETDRRLRQAATWVAENVDVAALQTIQKPADASGEAYAAIAATLAEAVTVGNIQWIGIYYRHGDFLYYWADSDESGVGYPFFYATEEHKATFEDRQVHHVRYTDEFGSYYGFIAPIVAPDPDGGNGKVIGIVEASISAESGELLERSTLAIVLPVLIAGIAIAIMAAILLTSLVFQHPLQQLQRGAQALAEQQFGYTIPLKTGDEMGDLATTFNHMSLELKNLYEQLQAYNRELETRVKERTAELREERNRLTTILENIADGLIVTNARGVIEVVNPAMERIVAHPVEELPGQQLYKVLPVAELNTLILDSLNEPYQIFNVNITWRPTGAAKNHTYKAVVGALVERETADVLGTVTILHDITHEAEVDQMKTDFISTVSHELRTPLTSVLGFGKLILKTFERHILPQIPDDRRTQQASQRILDNLTIIVSEAERLTRLINDVLDVAKIEAGKVEWHMDNITIGDVLQNAAAATNALARSKKLSVEVETDASLPCVYADRDRMVQVVTNLLSNAIKFTDTGGILLRARTVTLESDGTTKPDSALSAHLKGLESGPWIAVTVQDTGVGIAEENLEKVFEKFKQVGDLMTNRPKGTGLGLTICREIVEYHGGRIWAESTPGVGSIFTFVLPIKGALPTLAPIIEGIRSTSQETITPVTPKEARILVVDDEANIRNLLQQELSEAGYQVIQAADGIEGLRIARSERPDLIIMDLMMPGISGFDAISALRSDELTAHIPVLILSVLEDRERGYRLGADAYLTKPINAIEVLATVEKLLARAARGEGRKKALIIEEDASVADTLTRVFHEKGYEVVNANDGIEGITKALSERPRYIVLGDVLSKINDYEILRTLKCTRETSSACIVVMNRHESEEEVTRVLEHGADYCSKPEELDRILSNTGKDSKEKPEAQ